LLITLKWLTLALVLLLTYIHARLRLGDCDDTRASVSTIPTASDDAMSGAAEAQVAATTGSTATNVTSVPSDSINNAENALVAATAPEESCTAIIPAASTDIVEWQEYIDTVSGCPYYYDAVSGLTVWEKPAAEQEQQQEQQLIVVPTPPAFYYNARGNRVFCVPRQSTAA
jgi:WW domain